MLALPYSVNWAYWQVFCGKIPKDVLEDELIPLFENCGTLWDLRLMMDPVTKQCRSFCFVTFIDKSSVDAAVKQVFKQWSTLVIYTGCLWMKFGSLILCSLYVSYAFTCQLYSLAVLWQCWVTGIPHSLIKFCSFSSQTFTFGTWPVPLVKLVLLVFYSRNSTQSQQQQSWTNFTRKAYFVLAGINCLLYNASTWHVVYFFLLKVHCF